MTVKRFIAETARDALRRVKEELGPDAIVLANKPVAGGVEITAMSADSLDQISRQEPARPAQASGAGHRPQATDAYSGDDYTVSLSAKARSQAPFRPWQPPVHAPAKAAAPDEVPRPRPLPPREAAGIGIPSMSQVEQTLRAAADDDALAEPDANSPKLVELMSEMQTIKSLLERQLASFAWADLSRETPVKALLLAEMLDAGFSGQLARQLVGELPAELAAEDGRKWLKNAVNRRLRTLSTDKDIIDRGGVFALVGPTGVGKTTTTAKLAARCVVRYGADRLALLTTDSYRIGAHEQLRIYGRILGVPVHVVRDGEDLRRTLAELRDKHMVLIDTVGMSQRDRMVAEQAAMLTRAGEVHRLLLLNAGARGDTLDDVVRAYAGEDLAGCILTKVDEAASLAPALDVAVRHGLLLAYVTNGQRVPEDMHLPNRAYLLHRAFKTPATENAHRLRGDEVGLSLSSREPEPRPQRNALV